MKWEYLSKRRSITLESFLSGVSSVEDALRVFSEKQIDNPPIEEIKKMFKKKVIPVKQESFSEMQDLTQEKKFVIKKVKNAKSEDSKTEDQ